MHRFLSVCGKNAWKLIHISQTVRPRITKFGQNMEADNPYSVCFVHSQRQVASFFFICVCLSVCLSVKIKWVKPSLKVILKDGLSPTSSCIFILKIGIHFENTIH